MAHNIEIVNGEGSFFSANEDAWHHLGKVVTGAQTWEKAIKLAKMNWSVDKVNLKNPVTGEKLDSHFAIVRTDNNAVLGVVGERYEPMQNEFMFSFMDAVLDADGKAHYETAGVLGKGEQIFMTANLSSELDILGSGDKHRLYLVGCGSHDGSISTEFFASETRVVCNNTLTMARGKAKKDATVRVKRTLHAEARLNEKLETLQAYRDVFKSTGEKLEFLATRKINSAVVDRILYKVFEPKKGGDGTLDSLSGRAKGSVEIVQMLLESNDGDAFPQFRGTAYNLLNAFTEYSDHHREVRITSGRNGMAEAQMRAESAIFGSGAQFKQAVLDAILDEAQTLKSTNATKSYSLGRTDKQILSDILAGV